MPRQVLPGYGLPAAGRCGCWGARNSGPGPSIHHHPALVFALRKTLLAECQGKPDGAPWAWAGWRANIAHRHCCSCAIKPHGTSMALGIGNKRRIRKAQRGLRASARGRLVCAGAGARAGASVLGAPVDTKTRAPSGHVGPSRGAAKSAIATRRYSRHSRGGPSGGARVYHAIICHPGHTILTRQDTFHFCKIDVTSIAS